MSTLTEFSARIPNSVLRCWCLTLLLLACCLARAAQTPARTLTVQIPEDVPPDQVTIITGVYGEGLAVGPLKTEAHHHTYSSTLPAAAQSVKLLCYRPGYRMVTAEFTRAQLAAGTEFIPHFEPLPTTTITFTFVTTDGTPLTRTRFVLAHSLGTHQYFGYADGMMFFADMISGVTDGTGTCTLDLPQLHEDPYFAAHPVEMEIHLPGDGKHPSPPITPEGITFPVKTPVTITATLLPELKNHDLGFGHALLSAPAAVKLGEKFDIDIRFYNNGGGEYFYNPFFNRLIPLPAQLAIFDSEKKYLGDLIAWQGGSQVGVSASCWTSIPSGGYVGIRLRSFTAGYIPSLPPPRKFGAGDYYLQMIYYKVFTLANPARTADEKGAVADFYRNFDRTELFRSDIVQIHFAE